MIPLVLLHGFPFDNTLWNPVRALLAPTQPVYAPDLPGFGAEPVLPRVSMDALADWLAEWLVTRGVGGPVVIAGHSMGGYVALAFAARYRDRVAGLGLIHSTAVPDPPEKRAARDEQITHLKAYGAARLIPQLLAPLVAAENADRLAGDIDNFTDQAVALPASTLAAVIGALRDRPDRRDVLQYADFPVLFVAGKHDTVVPPAAAIALFHLTPPAANRCFCELPTAAHLGMLEVPAAVAAALSSLVNTTHAV